MNTSKIIPLLLFILLALTVSLSACGEGTVTEAVGTETITDQITFISDTPTRTYTSSPTSTATYNPTEQIWINNLASFDATQRTSLTATKQAVLSLEMQFPTNCAGQAYSLSVSPNNEWLASHCWGKGEFQIINRDGSVKWQIPYSALYFPPEHPNPNMIGDILPLHWTTDSVYLYFTTTYCCVHTDRMGYYDSLYRLNVQTGNWSELISGHFNYFSFSPTGRRFIHIPLDLAGHGLPVVINVIDLQTGTTDPIYLPGFEQAGHLFWNKDGLSFVITAKTGNYFQSDELYSIILVDLETKSTRSIVSNSKSKIRVINWIDDVLTIESSRYERPYTMEIYEYFYYDIDSDQFVTSTP